MRKRSAAGGASAGATHGDVPNGDERGVAPGNTTRELGRGRAIERRGLLLAGTGALCGGVLCGALALRIAEVNGMAVRIPEREYGMHEWLNMDDCYLGTEFSRAPGYGFMVTKAEIMSPNQYLERYAHNDVRRDDSSDADERCVVVVDLKVRNNGSEDVGVSYIMWQLVPEDRPDTVYYVDSGLLGQVHPELVQSSGFIVVPGEEPVLPVPFAGFAQPELFQPFDAYYRPTIAPGTFRLKMTDLPERRLFRFIV